MGRASGCEACEERELALRASVKESRALEAELRAEVARRAEEVQGHERLVEEQRSELERLEKALAEACERQEEVERQGGSEVKRLQAQWLGS